MLGPALSELFVELDKRKDKLTKYEEAIHGELLGILLTKQFEKSILGVGADVQARPAWADSTADIDVSEDYLSNIGPPGRINQILIGGGPTLKFQVDLSSGGGWNGSRKMQVDCTNTKCPNKVWAK